MVFVVIYFDLSHVLFWFLLPFLLVVCCSIQEQSELVVDLFYRQAHFYVSNVNFYTHFQSRHNLKLDSLTTCRYFQWACLSLFWGATHFFCHSASNFVLISFHLKRFVPSDWRTWTLYIDTKIIIKISRNLYHC